MFEVDNCCCYLSAPLQANKRRRAKQKLIANNLQCCVEFMIEFLRKIKPE